LRELANELHRQEREVEDKQRQLNKLKQGGAYPAKTNYSEGGISSEEERNHVIRVLEHECKVYKLEKTVLNSLGMGFQVDGQHSYY
jgi:hypothetical protein